jgi:peptidoglycan L-alanyl-D-glutamate endopeptidase CwlK
MLDKVSYDRIQLLHPMVRDEVFQIIKECNNKLTGRSQVRLAQGLRTFAEQDKLYAQGRTTPGKKVTNAKGGQSIHNYGTAVDIVLIIDGKEASWDIKKDWDGDKIADWGECVLVFAKYGWSWGGNWISFKDFPHFEKIGYNNWKVLINKKRDKNNYFIA